MALLDKSLLSFLNKNISGMVVPWIYLGMLFSSFCWHVEDHWTYSINYLHYGDIKTWYGIPSDNAFLMEDFIKKEFKDLFDTNCNLLNELHTLISPFLLKTNLIGR